MGTDNCVEDNAWVSEAVVNFLRGPLYTHPLMSFIDESCLVFTPEEENKFQYSEVHEEFKQLVDHLLTEFLADLGLSGEEFFDQVSKAQDQLSGFVVSTILTVDDFLMFKAMMVKRNIDLTNLVLQAVDEARKAAEGGGTGKPLASKGGSAFLPPGDKSENDSLQEAMQMSRALGAEDNAHHDLQQTLRLLQLEDEDVAMAVALAASLKDSAAADSELADINQAIALSLALDAELKRMKLEQQRPGSTAAEVPQDTGASCSSSNASSAPYSPASLPTSPPAAPAPSKTIKTAQPSAAVAADKASSKPAASQAPPAVDRTSGPRAPPAVTERTSDPRAPTVAAERTSAPRAPPAVAGRTSDPRAPPVAAERTSGPRVPVAAAAVDRSSDPRTQPVAAERTSSSSSSAPCAPTPPPAETPTPLAETAAAAATSTPVSERTSRTSHTSTSSSTPAPQAADADQAAAAHAADVAVEAYITAPVTSAPAAAAITASLPPVKPGPRTGGMGPGFVPQVQVPLSDLPPAKPRISSEGTPNPDDLSAGTSTFSTENSGQRRGAGYSSGPAPLNPSLSLNTSDLGAIREAARAAAETQKNMVAAKMPAGAEAEEWMAEQKAKLVAAKRAEREAETAAYKQQQQRPQAHHTKLGFGSTSAVAAAKDQEMEAKRAALRDKLAQGFKRNLIAPATPP